MNILPIPLEFGVPEPGDVRWWVRDEKVVTGHFAVGVRSIAGAIRARRGIRYWAQVPRQLVRRNWQALSAFLYPLPVLLKGTPTPSLVRGALLQIIRSE